MITYSIKYRKKNQWFWRSVKNVCGDAYPNFLGDSHMYFEKTDHTVVMVPKDGTEFKFSSGRHKLIQEQMHQESNGTVPKE